MLPISATIFGWIPSVSIRMSSLGSDQACPIASYLLLAAGQVAAAAAEHLIAAQEHLEDESGIRRRPRRAGRPISGFLPRSAAERSAACGT